MWLRAVMVAGVLLSGAHGSSPQAKGNAAAPVHTGLDAVRWESGDKYPPELQAVVRWKGLIGGAGEGRVPQPDVLMGVLELAPGAIYPAHKHPAPELYYVTGGTAEWTVGSETLTANAGTAIYHPPDTLHRMVNKGPEVLRAVYVWWAPGGEREVFGRAIDLVEAVPRQPPQATFRER